MNSLRHIAIVGCGFTGTSLFHQLVDRYPLQKLTIFEATGDFGPGYAYRTTECPDYLINNTTDTMCLTPASRRAFLDWLEEQPLGDEPIEPTGHLPRTLYGRFLQASFEATQTAAANKGIETVPVAREVTGLSPLDDGRIRLHWCDGETTADAVVLTTGRCPDYDRYPGPPANAEARYFSTQVMTPELDSVPADGTVHVLGASLSAYDVINRLFSEETGCRFARDTTGKLTFDPGENERRVVLCSRSGRLKAMQSRHPRPLSRTLLTEQHLRDSRAANELTLQDLRELIDDEAANHGVSIDWKTILEPYAGCGSVAAVTHRAAELLYESIRGATTVPAENFLVDLFADAQIELWDAFAARLLSHEDEQRYRQAVETAALAYAAPCPVPTGERLLALMEAGRLSIVKGVRGVTQRSDASGYDIEHDFGKEAASILIDATGSTHRDVRHPKQSPLVRGLVEQGALRGYERGGAMPGADVDMQSFGLPGLANVYLANMFLWGPGLMTSSAFIMATVAERIVDGLLERARHTSI